MEVKKATADHLEGVATIRIGEKILEVPFSRLETGPTPISPLFRLVIDSTVRDTGKDVKLLRAVIDLSRNLGRLAPANVISLAPTRTQPQRVYSHVTEAYKPTGEHIPFVLEKLMEEDIGSARRQSLSRLLKTFGRESGLFSDLAVSRFGTSTTAPFEVRVALADSTMNLVDVGYGVSQALPVLVEAATSPRDQFLLLQQPEIHLHPRAQAALGTLFAQLAAENHCRLMVETHSDYLMDRVRQEVAAGKIAPDMVALLYLHREGLESKCHLIELDDLGNLINPPDDYRSFFLEETRQLLGRGAKH